MFTRLSTGRKYKCCWPLNSHVTKTCDSHVSSMATQPTCGSQSGDAATGIALHLSALGPQQDDEGLEGPGLDYGGLVQGCGEENTLHLCITF